LGETITVLITGGSQGSRTLNRAAEQSWPLWPALFGPLRFRLIHQTGPQQFQEISSTFASAGVAGEVTEFIADMPGAFAEADIVVSRSGMGAVSELAAAGKPSILVPFPAASDQHQLKNAQAMQKAGASILIEDPDFTGARLVEEATRLASDPGLMQQMSAAARAFAKPGAAQIAADILESLAMPLSSAQKD
jgi:UDP-N-acetylglucosamine--N-acetylmuramyl-(pentapeptide) pyrophosphoryl-undecaprenol N-acetylglucosamine transferase